jgi:DNA-binding CsgD family transcriptional regulator
MLIGDPAARASAAELVAGAAPGVERAELYRILAHTRDDDYVEALCYVEEALKEAPHEHPVRVGVLRSHATMLLVNGDVAGARGSAQVALDLAERLTCQVPETRAHALLLDVFAGTPVDVGALRADTPSSASTQESQQLHVTLGQCLLYRGLFADAREILGTAERTSFHLGVDAMRAMALFYLVELECHAACYAEADRLANEGLDVIAQLDWPQWESALLAAKALVDAYLGRIADARRRVAEGIELSGRVGDQLFGVKNDRVLGFVELSNGNVRAAADILGRAADRVREMGFGNPVVFAVLPDAIHALLAAGEIPRARCFLQELEDAGRRLDAPWSLAQAARYRGVLAAGEGRLADAEAAFAEAFRQHERVDAPFEKGRTLLARGEVLRRAKRKRAARESLEAAAATFTALGTPLWAAHAAAALQRVGGRPAATDALTASERRVAELVALGRSNKEVAAELFVTVRTVEAHLSKVYAKLGLRSRAELARRMQL